MHRLTIASLVAAGTLISAAFILSESPAWGQAGGRPNPMQRPKHKLHKNRSPVLSPNLNMLPGTSTTFEGQFLMRQLPQEQIYKNAEDTRQSNERLQNEIDQTENRIKSGIGKTGHRTMFMNYGGYYQIGRGSRRQ